MHHTPEYRVADVCINYIIMYISQVHRLLEFRPSELLHLHPTALQKHHILQEVGLEFMPLLGIVWAFLSVYVRALQFTR